jgi:hypothetical protein
MGHYKKEDTLQARICLHTPTEYKIKVSTFFLKEGIWTPISMSSWEKEKGFSKKPMGSLK